MSDLHELTALEAAAAIRRGDITALDAVDAALARAERLGPELGAFALLTPERARDAARALDRAGVAGAGPLAGVPTAVKDLTATAGVPTRRGSVIYDGWVPDRDDEVVGLLREAGTISIGKTAVPEFGLPCYTEPAGAPPAVTPWDRTRSAGGSSGGAAAAVAAGVLPVAHGTDGGGSIRIPAAVCGLVGLKTTRGRVPAGPAGGDPAGLSVHGPLARTVADAAALLDAVARPSAGEPFVPAAPPAGGYLGALARPVGRRRIALAVDPPIDGHDVVVDPACRAAAEEVGALLEDLGHDVEPVRVRLPDEGVAAFLTLWQVLSLGDPVDPVDEPRLLPLTRYLRARGREYGGAAAMGALHTVQVVTRRLVAERAGYDAVLTPTVALPPRPVGWFTAGGDPADDFARQIAFTPWTAIANLTGEPAISLPVCWSDGLPIGTALRGRRGEEDVLLGLAAELEAARPWRDRRPPEG
ncbi:amidase [Actinomycetospora straminea]|uniref:Amidase n=1 Tax=Actinomycetospora straminea TaxID=663607 RepID=A0ABP9FCJ4_9PSEU|nr:amidase family protein [Actinomycetospora straminea]MDD7935416.1 amidase family protein [Actinomycetospora straminea]